MQVYAVRHANGNYLPVTGRGSTHYDFHKQVKAPRLFEHKRAAQNFILYWLKGRAHVVRETPGGPDWADDGGEYVVYKPDPTRNKSQLSIVTFELIEVK